MSKVCGAYGLCHYSPEQNSGGCPCAELCPGYCEPCRVTTSNKTEQVSTHIQNMMVNTTWTEEGET